MQTNPPIINITNPTVKNKYFREFLSLSKIDINIARMPEIENESHKLDQIQISGRCESNFTISAFLSDIFVLSCA